MALNHRFISVPDRSTLFIETVGPATGFTISAELRSGSTLLKSWRHEELVTAEQDHELRTPRVYSLIVDVAFTQNENVAVEMRVRIIKPDDTQHSKTKTLSFSGRRPTAQHGRVQIITEQS